MPNLSTLLPIGPDGMVLESEDVTINGFTVEGACPGFVQADQARSRENLRAFRSAEEVAANPIPRITSPDTTAEELQENRINFYVSCGLLFGGICLLMVPVGAWLGGMP